MIMIPGRPKDTVKPRPEGQRTTLFRLNAQARTEWLRD